MRTVRRVIRTAFALAFLFSVGCLVYQGLRWMKVLAG